MLPWPPPPPAAGFWPRLNLSTHCTPILCRCALRTEMCEYCGLEAPPNGLPGHACIGVAELRGRCIPPAASSPHMHSIATPTTTYFIPYTIQIVSRRFADLRAQLVSSSARADAAEARVKEAEVWSPEATVRRSSTLPTLHCTLYGSVGRTPTPLFSA
jgi:hypothetical protein